MSLRPTPAKPDMIMHPSIYYIHVLCTNFNRFTFFFLQDFAIEDVLSEYDTDKDGFISLSEFIGNVRSEGKKTTDVVENPKLFVVVVD